MRVCVRGGIVITVSTLAPVSAELCFRPRYHRPVAFLRTHDTTRIQEHLIKHCTKYMVHLISS